MAKTKIASIPSLTVDSLLKIVRDKYMSEGFEIAKSSLIGADIYIRKSAWVGVAIKLKQKEDGTHFRVTGYAPSLGVRLLMYGLITLIILYPKWKKMERETIEFLESKAFQDAAKSAQ